ncbi:MAG: SLBB domain-containing protein [Deltaproteobacteria bacterium]|nr:SLBB domain-containing protein [Deltaproteobacteria bacterium]
MKNISISISKILLLSFVLQVLFPYYAWAQVTNRPTEEIRNPSFRTGSGGGAAGTGVNSATSIRDDTLLMGSSNAGGSGGGASGGGGGTSLGSASLIYQVHILGEVNRPGTYRIPASSRLYEALQMAGGLRPNGSERDIAIRKPGTQKKVDLFAYKFQGSLEDNPYLMDNDVIFIPIRKKVVEIEGSVYRPGVYELKGEKNIADLLKLAGGYTQGYSASQPLKVIRYIDEKKQLLDVSGDEVGQFKIESGDVIVIPHLFTKNNSFDYNIKQFPSDNLFYPSFEDRIFLTGGVQTPGAYAFNPSYKLGNYLAIAGGTTKMAKKEIRIVDNKGMVRKVKSDSELILNPGDVVFIPEKRFTPEGWLSVFTSIVGFGLSTTATVLSLKNLN